MWCGEGFEIQGCIYLEKKILEVKQSFFKGQCRKCRTKKGEWVVVLWGQCLERLSFAGLWSQVVTRSDSVSGVQKKCSGKVVGIGFAWYTAGAIWCYRAFQAFTGGAFKLKT